MKATELISKLEQQGNFKDDPEVTALLDGPGEISYGEITRVRAGEDGKIEIFVGHQCPDCDCSQSPVYFWNGKRLDDLTPDEMRDTIIGLITASPTPVQVVKTPQKTVEEPKPTAVAPAPAKS